MSLADEPLSHGLPAAPDIERMDDGKILDGQCPVDGQTMSSLTRAHASASAGASSKPEPFPPDLTDYFTALWNAYPAAGRTKITACQGYYCEIMEGKDEAAVKNLAEQIIRPVVGGGKWARSEKWSKGFICGLDTYLVQRMWLEDPPQAQSQASRYDDIPVFDLKAERERDARLKAERETGMQ